jgi:hypothetical protein
MLLKILPFTLYTIPLLVQASPRQITYLMLQQQQLNNLNTLSTLSLSLMLRPTVSRPVCLGMKHPSGAYDQFFFFFVRNTECVLTVSFLIPCVALSDERMGLSFVYAAGPCQHSLSPVLVPWDLRLYFTVSDLRFPFSSPPTTRRVTVEVFDPASTRVLSKSKSKSHCD